MEIYKNRRMLTGAALLCTFALTLSVLPVHATDSIESLESQTSALENELAGINQDILDLSNQISDTEMQIEILNSSIDKTQDDLLDAEEKENKQYEDMKTRIKYMYENGNASLLEMLHVERYHHNPNMWEYIRTTRIPTEDIFGLVDRESRSLDKVQALFADLDERARAWKELETLEEVEIVGSLKYNIEVNAAGVNKGSGLVELGKRLGIEREEIMAFGDGDNDEPMLREAGFGVAMANAEEKVKATADYITGSNEEDGVAKAIERFVLEGGEVC